MSTMCYTIINQNSIAFMPNLTFNYAINLDKNSYLGKLEYLIKF